MRELIENAFTGVNIIPTVLLIIVLFYWLIVIIGIIDLDLFDFDIDLDAADNLEGFQGILVFFNVAQVPFMVVLSILILSFWVISMWIYLLPIKPGGIVNGLLFIPAIILSLVVTKSVTNGIKGLFKSVNVEENKEEDVINGQLLTLLCDVKYGRLGQGEIKRDGASILINVKAEFEEDSFKKYEEAYVTKKDDEKNIYYIVKTYSK